MSAPMESSILDNLPKTVVRKLNQGSCIRSVDFHPIQQTLLLVGTNGGTVTLWDVGTEERLYQNEFMVWLPKEGWSIASQDFRGRLVKPSAAITCIRWSPDGSLFGVAYSKPIIQLFTYSGNDVQRNIEIFARSAINDLTFCPANGKLCVVTCSDNKLIEVWDVVTGDILYMFEGHERLVSSICPRYNENTLSILSTGLDGKIKEWLYGNSECKVTCDAPGDWSINIRSSTNGLRRFWCGINQKDLESYIFEWDESKETIGRSYQGLKKSLCRMHFDTTDKVLAAGDEHVIKIWDMDNINLLTTIGADGDLPERPLIRFNKEGSLLAVCTSSKGIKILATNDGLQFLHKTFENLSVWEETNMERARQARL